MMDIEEIKTYLNTIKIKDLEIFYDYEIRNLSTFRQQGKCFIFIIAHTEDALLLLLNFLNENNVKYYIIGRGSNTLINDNCKDIIIKPGRSFDFIEFYDNGLIAAGASCILGKFINRCYKNNYDFSFLAGIPGTIGGAVYGNCGNKIMAICDYIESMECLRFLKNKIIKERIKIKPLNYGYRFLKIENLAVITKVFFKKEKVQKELIFINIRDKVRAKKISQPLNTFNCGCFFKNPLNSIKTAGQLIDSLGLKGFAYGGAAVSKKHANFIENKESASSEDIYDLSKIIKGLVSDNFKINLEYEVKLVGFTN
ncbi:MAG: UDP-N-acetylmuramate dehydrogenase [Cyanobacteria bacterium]|nr:UDP-N-acetylmuramate dehydrogenase [Cyanobacteriota bacterium]